MFNPTKKENEPALGAENLLRGTDPTLTCSDDAGLRQAKAEASLFQAGSLFDQSPGLSKR